MGYTKCMTVAMHDPDDPDDVEFVTPDAPVQGDEDATELMWMERNAAPFHPTPEHPFRATRCTGVTRTGPRAGKRCGRKSTLGTNVCEKHGAALPSVKKAADNRRLAIQLRLVSMTSDAVETIDDLRANSSSDAVRLKAATEILDRAGVRGGSDLNVTVETVDTASAQIREKLEQLRKRTIEGELALPGGTVVPVDSSDSPVPVEPHPAEENPDG